MNCIDVLLEPAMDFYFDGW